MSKLLKAFNINPTANTARALLKHLNKHPMAACYIPTATIELAKQLGV